MSGLGRIALLAARLLPHLPCTCSPPTQERAASGRARERRRLTLFVMALLAISVAFVLSPPGMSAWAWYQSPVSPVSPVSTQLSQTPTSSPTVPAIPETPSSLETQPPPSSGSASAMLVAGGIVLAGLVAGAVVLLIRGQPPDESVP